ncbi:MAG TPA: 2-dehydropantoate 2-reductase [Candidatus Acidoferrum sp.]|jgi:2-dehydropantoate 2-reductase|nr:2-dehydropantoate 2-reductase [Candidatus Acidoferrum sp.]
MSVAIVGAGAIGGLLGAYLSRSGEDVILIARGPHLAAMRSRGVTVHSGGGEFTARPECTDDMSAIGRANVVFLTLKAHSIPAVAKTIGANLGENACIVGAQNGIPWWYFEHRQLESVDPGGVIARNLPYRKVVGCIAYPAAQVVEPGIIEHLEGNRFTLGEPDGTRSERVQAIASMLVRAGLKAPIQTRIRNEIWLKLLGNATLNPLSALTRATLAEIITSPITSELVRTLMEEVDAVASAVGVEVVLTIEKRMAGAAATGDHKTSMLQDLEAGRPLEIDALVGAVVELAGGAGVPVPALSVVYRLAKLLDERTRAGAS